MRLLAVPSPRPGRERRGAKTGKGEEKMIRGIFVRNDGPVPYADKIVDGEKTIETRSRNTLGKLVGHPVVIIATARGKKPACIGFAWITAAYKGTAESLDRLRGDTLIPVGSEYDTGSRWCYLMDSPHRFKNPVPVPAHAIYHGRSWCEW